jgi:hypothetical protein
LSSLCKFLIKILHFFYSCSLSLSLLSVSLFSLPFLPFSLIVSLILSLFLYLLSLSLRTSQNRIAKEAGITLDALNLFLCKYDMFASMSEYYRWRILRELEVPETLGQLTSMMKADKIKSNGLMPRKTKMEERMEKIQIKERDRQLSLRHLKMNRAR